MFYLTTHSTHFIYGYMASDIWLRTILIVRKETCCRHIGYSYRLTARVLLYAPSHRQDNTYHGLCYTSRGALAGTRNSSMGQVIKKTLHTSWCSGHRPPTGVSGCGCCRWLFPGWSPTRSPLPWPGTGTALSLSDLWQTLETNKIKYQHYSIIIHNRVY